MQSLSKQFFLSPKVPLSLRSSNSLPHLSPQQQQMKKQ
jgi:hypothetical protein